MTLLGPNSIIKNLEILISGKKIQYQWQGYCAYLNSVLVLSLFEVLINKAKYHSNFFLIDTPFDTLAQNSPEITDNLKLGMINYLFNHQDIMLVILFKNSDHLPNLDNYKNKINVIEFTGDKNNGRYGYLNGIANPQ